MENVGIFFLWYLWFLLWIFSLCGYGYLFSIAFIQNSFLDKTIYKIWFYGITGCILVSSIVILLNLFISISFPISVGLLVIGLIGSLFWCLREKHEKHMYAAFFVLTSVVTYTAVLLFGRLLFADTMYYHLHTIDWIVSSPLPYGLANTMARLGFVSSWFPLGAVVEQLLFLFNYPIFLINAIILTFYGMLLVSIIHATYTRNKGNISLTQIITNLTYSEWFFILSIWPVSVFSFRYFAFVSSPSPDYPAFLLTLIVFGAIINYIESESQEKNNLLWLALICAMFACGVKFSAIMLVPLVLLLIGIILLRETPFTSVYEYIYIFIKNIPIWVYLLSCLAIIPACIRAFITSGSPIYPKTIPIIHNLIPWAVPYDIAKGMSDDVLAWARAPGPGYLESLHGYDWVSGWIFSFARWEGGILTFLPALSIGIFIYLTYYSLRRQERVESESNSQNFTCSPFFMLGAGLIFCFFSALWGWFHLRWFHLKTLLFNWIISLQLVAWQKEVLALLLILFIGIFICLAYYSIRRQKKVGSESNFPELAWYPFFMIGVGLLFWFFTGPDPRFGVGYLFSCALYIIIFPYIVYLSIPKHVVTWSKIGITLIFVIMTFGVIGDVGMNPDSYNLPKPMQALTYIEYVTNDGETLYMYNFTYAEMNNVVLSRHPLLSVNPVPDIANLTITRDPITGYYRMFQIRRSEI